MSEETPIATSEETKPTEPVEQPRNKNGTYAPKPKIEPLYSKREPTSTDKIGSFSSTLKDYRDVLLEQIDIELDEEFEKQPMRRQIDALKAMVTYKKKITETRDDTNPDAPTEQPLDKTGKAEIGGEVPAPTIEKVPSLLEKNRADIMVREARKKTGFGQYRDKWKQ